MKSLCVVALLALAVAGVARGQENLGPLSQTNLSVASDAGATAATPAAEAEAQPAAPAPRFVYGSRDDFRWQLALGLSVLRFRSPFFYATGVGTDTSVTYFTNEWFGVEGKLNTAFAPTIYRNEHVKFVGYGAGPKAAWRRGKWEPWAHVVVGGMHVFPEVANHGKNGFEVQIGGGADYRIFPHLSARMEADWLKMHVFGVWRNTGQINGDIVLHF